MGSRGVTSGKVRTEQRIPVAGGDFFGQHDRIVAQRLLLSGCRGHSHGRDQRASRSRPESLLLTEKREGERDGMKKDGQRVHKKCGYRAAK